MATPINKKLYITTVNGLPSIQEMSDIESDPNRDYLRTQFTEVKSADQLRSAAGQAQGYYGAMVNRYQPGDSYRNTIEAAATKQGFYGKDISKLSDEELFAGLKSSGYYGGDVNQGLSYLRGATLGGDYMTLNPDEQKQYGFDSPFVSKKSYDEAIKQKADVASGKLVQIGSMPRADGTVQPLYAPAKSPAAVKAAGGTPSYQNVSGEWVAANPEASKALGASTPGKTTTPAAPKTGGGGAPVVDVKQEVSNLDAEANKLMEEELARIKSETNKVDLSKSASLVESITKMLDEKPAAETSMVNQFADQRAKLGVEPLETELDSLDAEIDKLDADYASATQGEEGRQVSMSQVRRRQSAEGIQYERAKRDLVAERNSVARELNTKIGVVEAMVKYAGMDADNARADYQQKFTQAVSAANLFKGIEEDAKSDEERKQDNARANVQIMYNLIKDGNVDTSKMDAQTLANLRVAELQAGFPSGFTSLISQKIDEPVVSFGSEYTNTAGERMQPVYTRNKATGAVTVKNVVLGQAKSETSATDTKKAQEDDVATAILDFQNKMTKNQWSGANPDAYDYYRSELVKLYGASAALALDKAMSDAGITVDRENK